MLSGCQQMADRHDLKALRRQAQVPPYAALVSFAGFPFTVGPREALSLSAIFSIPSDKANTFLSEIRMTGSQWQPLPIPTQVRERITFRFPAVNFDTRHGYFRCRTASDNILHERDTASCLTPKAWVQIEKGQPRWERQTVPLSSIDAFADIIISVYEPETRLFVVGIASGY
jgi:hypothetical protein